MNATDRLRREKASQPSDPNRPRKKLPPITDPVVIGEITLNLMRDYPSATYVEIAEMVSRRVD